jgi:type II secretory pathway pseudopilin PulG
LELLIVTGLLASLVALGWPSVHRALQRGQLRRAVQEVVDFLREAQQRALLTQSPQLVRWDPPSRELALLEVQFDQAGADLLGAAAAPGRVTRPQPVMRIDANDPQDVAAAALQASPQAKAARQDQPGPDLRLIDRLKLVDDYVLVVADPQSPAEFAAPTAASDVRIGARQESVLPSPTTEPLAQPSRILRLVFDARGNTANLELLVVGPRGDYTPLHIEGALGRITAGQPQRLAPSETVTTATLDANERDVASDVHLPPDPSVQELPR